jgi:hypothetical protein
MKIGIMGSAKESLTAGVSDELRAKAEALGRAIASRNAIAFTGATTGLPEIVGRAARAAGAMHVGVSPAESESQHASLFGLPTDECDVTIYTGFGLKGRNVVLVRSCDIVLFIAGSIGALNEFTIAYDEGKIIGCLAGTGGVADEADRLMKTFPKETNAVFIHGHDPERLVAACVEAHSQRLAIVD